jgi:hypothetical protein
LGKKTKNIVQAEVREKGMRPANDLGQFAYIFYLVAPALDDYRSKLFEINYNLALYPVKIELDEEILREIRDMKIPASSAGKGTSVIEANSEKQFKEFLKAIFNSKKVLRIISILLSQSDPSYDPSLKEETQ